MKRGLDPNVTLVEIFSLEGGTIRVEWPAKITEGDWEDVKPWMDILKRKIGRISVVATEYGEEGTE